jgi:hypothetical protein
MKAGVISKTVPGAGKAARSIVMKAVSYRNIIGVMA